MSAQTYPVPPALQALDPAGQARLWRLLQRFLRPPQGMIVDLGPDQRLTALEFDPPLTPTEEQRLQAILALLACPFDWTPDDLTVFRAEQATLAGYLTKNQPTQAETAAAVKALIRVVRAIIRTS